MKKIIINGKNILIDDEDYPLLSVHKCYWTKRYPTIVIERKTIILGRVIAITHNLCQEKQVVLYKDENPGNVQKYNLIIMDYKEAAKRRNFRLGNTGERGIYFAKANRKYKVTLYKENRLLHLGYFNTLEEAKRIYREAKNESNNS